VTLSASGTEPPAVLVLLGIHDGDARQIHDVATTFFSSGSSLRSLPLLEKRGPRERSE